MLNAMMENENICCEHDLRERIEILAKLAFSISIIVFNMMKFLVIPFIKKLIAQINIFKYVCTIASCSPKWLIVLQKKKKKKCRKFRKISCFNYPFLQIHEKMKIVSSTESATCV